MQVTIRLFAGLRERAGTDSLDVELPDEGATVQQAIDAASAQIDGGLQMRGHIMLALNREYVEADHSVKDGDEVALIPPVSGGAALQTGLPENFQNVFITSEPLDPEPLTDHVTTDEDGAVVTFLGVTRNHNAGRDVEYLEYEAYRPMADEQINALIDEMKSRWEIGRVAIAHRTGRIEIGETSMVVAVGAAHRKPAFEAALYFIDRLKEVVPIWKKEFFSDGEVWIGETPGGNPE